MKHWSTISLALIALAFAASAFAEQHTAKITGYPSTITSATEYPDIARQASDIERKIMAEISANNGKKVTLTIDIYGNADEAGPKGDNEDYARKRAVEVVNLFASRFENLPNVTARLYPHGNGTKQKERSTEVLWTITATPLVAAQSKGPNVFAWIISLFGLAFLVGVTLFVLLRRKPQVTIAPAKRKFAYANADGRTFRGLITPKMHEGEVMGFETPFEGENHFRKDFDAAKAAFKSSIKKATSLVPPEDPKYEKYIQYKTQLERLLNERKIEEVPGGEALRAEGGLQCH